MTNPVYKHDCSECTFLGTESLAYTPVDIYVCNQIGSPTIVIRFSSEPSEYTTWNFIFFKTEVAYTSDETFLLAHSYYERAKKAIHYKG